MKAKLLTLAIVLLAQTSFAGWFGPSTKALTVQEANKNQAACRAMDENISSEIQSVLVQVQNGELAKGSPEARIAIAKAFVKAYEKEGYSLDATLAYCLSQRDTNFWSSFWSTYGDSLNYFLSGLKDDNFQQEMLSSEVLSQVTISAWGEYAKWQEAEQQ